ncbi:hypothetical protein TrLO_g7458 [Triparma laevis f. longispina]|uniref:Uncharacterized protein n=1 Tax=Triparma laevis f. longispina TaxID=1714387 RepID=A0A9W6ZKV5_9STRA|nr:hypothetical protein TrLO_g7458 [Triparma laevis f. longispina]
MGQPKDAGVSFNQLTSPPPQPEAASPSPLLLPLPPPQTPQTPHLINECANFYVGPSFVLSTLSAPLYLHAVLNSKDKNDKLFEKTDNFWSWTLIPINIGAT